ncbi:general secretion pathway protein GspD [Massilia sp. R798]|uniref:General secretion pathway protein GspD n=2 Tax=Massilia soli TaxID=2792854 RepID=A0ABS7SKY7_9BURK|nr:general secretion pathway protein GspD [Massilia soli]
MATPRMQQLGRLLALSLLAIALAGCAAQMAYRDGRDLVAQDKVEEGLLKYQEAIAKEPGNAVYRAAFLRERDRNALRLLDQAERHRAAGKGALALQDYSRVLAFDPANERARAGLLSVEMDERHARMLEAAAASVDKKEFEQARLKLAAILAERPQHEQARLMLARVGEQATERAPEDALAAAFRQPITIEFREAPLKQVFEVISRRSGLNFVFDKDVKADQRTSIFLKNSTVEAAVYYLMVGNQLAHQVMDGNTILVYPNSAVKLKEYQELTVKTFFLANAEAKTIVNTLKTILKARDVVADEKLNLVIMRDNPEAIRIASRLVALQDVAEAEVMLDVEILEIKRSRMLELGIAWPNEVTLAPLRSFGGGQLTLDNLRDLRRRDIGVSALSATVTAAKTDGDSNTLANPRIRVRNKEKAKVVIGDKVPNVTTTISPGAGGFASESVNYIDVGLTLNVEPTIYLNNEVAIRISLEVSNLVSTITTPNGTTAYQIGSRSASTMLQLKDGETQVLAGLINSEDRSSGSKVPGLGNLPILGRLFGTTRDDNEKTEIVLSITPHLVRTVQRPPASQSEFNAGTEASFRSRPDQAPRTPVVIPVRQQPQQAAPSAIPSAPPPAAPASQAPQAVPVPAGVPAAPQVTPIAAPTTTTTTTTTTTEAAEPPAETEE